MYHITQKTPQFHFSFSPTTSFIINLQGRISPQLLIYPIHRYLANYKYLTAYRSLFQLLHQKGAGWVLLAWGLQRRSVFSSKSYNALLHPNSIEILKMNWGNGGFPVISRGRFHVPTYHWKRQRCCSTYTIWDIYINSKICGKRTASNHREGWNWDGFWKYLVDLPEPSNLKRTLQGFFYSLLLMAAYILSSTTFLVLFFFVNTRTEHPLNICRNKQDNMASLQIHYSSLVQTLRDLYISKPSLLLWKILLVQIHHRRYKFYICPC